MGKSTIFMDNHYDNHYFWCQSQVAGKSEVVHFVPEFSTFDDQGATRGNALSGQTTLEKCGIHPLF